MTTMTTMPRKRWRFGRPSRPTADGPALAFAPLAWLKWQYLCHAGPTEVAGFGLSAADDPRFVEDVLVVRQRATAVTVAFDDAAVADLFDAMVDRGVPPERFARIWLHTHPGASVVPSSTDEETFARAFGDCDWAVMAILGRAGTTSARLQVNVGPRVAVEMPVQVDWSRWPAAVDDPERSLLESLAEWRREYAALVEVETPLPPELVAYDDAFFEDPPARTDVDPYEAFDSFDAFGPVHPFEFDPFFPGALHESPPDSTREPGRPAAGPGAAG